MADFDLIGALYDHFGWRVPATPIDVGQGRLAETHEFFHRQLDDTTSFGSLMATVAALAEALPRERWTEVRGRLVAMSDLVHETFAVGMSLLTTQRPIEQIDNYPTYDRYVRTVQRMLGADADPWVALAALRAGATACMQTRALAAASRGLLVFSPAALALIDRPNHRLAALLAGGFADDVAREETRSSRVYASEPWWQSVGPVRLPPEALDGAAANGFEAVYRRLFAEAEKIIVRSGGTVVATDGYEKDLRLLLDEANGLAPDLPRIGALMTTHDDDLSHGGPLDAQTVELTAAPRRATLLPYGSLSGLSGEGNDRHAFVVVTTPRRLRSAYHLEGISLPDEGPLACLRATLYDGEERDSILLLHVDGPEQLAEEVPVYVSILSSAATEDPERTSHWMRAFDTEHVSLVMDTPATPALRSWCADGARFRTETRLVLFERDEVRVIAGRIEAPGRRSPLILIVSTEFGARYFEAVCAEDPRLGSAVIKDDRFFEREGIGLDIALFHLLLEERFLGTGSWRR